MLFHLFNKGIELHDPDKLLEETGKISRYVEIKSDKQKNSPDLKKLLLCALKAYRERMNEKKFLNEF